jgi:hypothetical protein
LPDSRADRGEIPDGFLSSGRSNFFMSVFLFVSFFPVRKNQGGYAPFSLSSTPFDYISNGSWQ